LLELKKQYKEATGKDWKPPQEGAAASPKPAEPSSGNMASQSDEAQELKSKIDSQGEKVRQLKTSGASKVKYIHVYNQKIDICV